MKIKSMLLALLATSTLAHATLGDTRQQAAEKYGTPLFDWKGSSKVDFWLTTGDLLLAHYYDENGKATAVAYLRTTNSFEAFTQAEWTELERLNIPASVNFPVLPTWTGHPKEPKPADRWYRVWKANNGDCVVVNSPTVIAEGVIVDMLVFGTERE